MARQSKIGRKAAKLKQKARVEFAKALGAADIKTAKLRQKERLKKAKKAGRR